jgi:acetyl-CoA acyltransferase
MAGYVGRDAVIVGAVRTPIGKGKAGGALHDVLPVDLLAHSLKELVNRTGIDRRTLTTSSRARSPRWATRL